MVPNLILAKRKKADLEKSGSFDLILFIYLKLSCCVYKKIIFYFSLKKKSYFILYYLNEMYYKMKSGNV